MDIRPPDPTTPTSPGCSLSSPHRELKSCMGRGGGGPLRQWGGWWCTRGDTGGGRIFDGWSCRGGTAACARSLPGLEGRAGPRGRGGERTRGPVARAVCVAGRAGGAARCRTARCSIGAFAAREPKPVRTGESTVATDRVVHRFLQSPRRQSARPKARQSMKLACAYLAALATVR